MISASVTNIGNQAFYYCTSLIAFKVDALNPVYSSMNGVLFNAGQTTLIQFPGGVGGSYTIPATVTNIADTAFYYCQNLARVTIPDNVLSIGVAAFANCGGLTNVTIGNGVTSIGDSAFVRLRPDQPHHWQQRHQHRGQCVLLAAPWPASRSPTVSPASETRRSLATAA